VTDPTRTLRSNRRRCDAAPQLGLRVSRLVSALSSDSAPWECEVRFLNWPKPQLTIHGPSRVPSSSCIRVSNGDDQKVVDAREVTRVDGVER
jgi:hypothetical protein